MAQTDTIAQSATWMHHTLAMQQARKAVLERIKWAGYRLTDTTAKEITAAATAYLDANEAECYGRAADIISRSPVLQKMLARDERDRARSARLTTGAQRRWR